MVEISGKNIIVTGGSGFIGSNLVERLCKDNKVHVIDNMHTGSKKNLYEAMKSGNVTLHESDVKNIGKLGIHADLIFHLGMYSASPMYRENPHLVSEVVDGMISVLEYAKANKVQVVLASTSSIYNGINPPHKEDIVPKVTDYYTEARIAAERLSELYSKLHGVNVAAMRFFSIYGRHEESKKGYANLITQFIWAMRKGESPVIYGDGKQKRDFVYVSDVVEALIKGTAVKGFLVINVGTGKNYTINEMVEKINSALGTNVPPKYIAMPVSNYVMETLADTTKAERLIGFKASVSLDDGIRRIIKEEGQ
jgi:UDP-glucose 4-epimerase